MATVAKLYPILKHMGLDDVNYPALTDGASWFNEGH